MILFATGPVIPNFGGGGSAYACERANRLFCPSWVSQNWDSVLWPALRQHVGRLLNDKMPTGVAVSAAMNHGGPFPATGHPGFTSGFSLYGEG